jgi:hypothetical protein
MSDRRNPFPHVADPSLPAVAVWAEHGVFPFVGADLPGDDLGAAAET